MNKTVDIVVERQWFAPALGRALMKGGLLGCIHTGFPKSRYVSEGIPSEKLKTSPFPAIWNHLIAKCKLPSSLAVDEPSSLASVVAVRKNLAPVITCLATSYQHLFPKLVGRPVIRVIECGSMHPEENFHLQQRGRREAGLPSASSLPPRIAAECEAAKLAHFLVCGSKLIVESYLRRGYRPDRVLHCPYGMDPNRFRFVEREAAVHRPLRIATVGVIGIRKGIFRLLAIGEWAERAGIELELHLIGPVEAEAENLIARSSARCKRYGVLKGDALVHALHQADAYCLPSYEEGFGISIIEAMSTGLPAIVSDTTGGKEAISEGADGLILSDFSIDEFEAKLRPWFSQPGLLVAAGAAAARNASEHHSAEAYARSVAACYQQAFELSSRLLQNQEVLNAYPS